MYIHHHPCYALLLMRQQDSAEFSHKCLAAFRHVRWPLSVAGQPIKKVLQCLLRTQLRATPIYLCHHHTPPSTSPISSPTTSTALCPATVCARLWRLEDDAVPSQTLGGPFAQGGRCIEAYLDAQKTDNTQMNLNEEAGRALKSASNQSGNPVKWHSTQKQGSP